MRGYQICSFINFPRFDHTGVDFGGVRFTTAQFQEQQVVLFMSDVAMIPASPRGTKRKTRAVTTSAEIATQTDGAQEAGSGLPVVPYTRIPPHVYNNQYTVKLTYADNFFHTLPCDGSTSVSQIFRSNSLWDPDQTGTGHQPHGRDLWASMYNYYTVLSCEYTIRMFNCSWDSVTYTAGGANGQRPTCVNVNFVRSTSTGDWVNNAYVYPQAEMKNVSTFFLCPDQKMLEISGVVTPGDFLVDAADSDSDNTWTAIGTNPNVSRHIGYKITSALNTTLTGVNETPSAAVQVQVILHYTAQFTEVNTNIRRAIS